MKTILMKRTLLLFTVSLFFLPLVSCQEEPKMGQERRIESSGNVPKWVKKPPKDDRKHHYFVGQDTAFEKDHRYAYQMALSEAGSFISTQTNSLFQKTEESLNVEKANVLKESFIKNISNASVKGAKQKDMYWEKIEKLTESGFKYYFRIYVLVQISKQAIEDSQKATLQLEIEKNRQSENKEILTTLKILESRLQAKSKPSN